MSKLSDAMRRLSEPSRGNRKQLTEAPYKREYMPEKERWLREVDGRPGVPEQVHRRFGECVCGSSPWPFVLTGEPGSGKTCAALVWLDMYGGRYYTAQEWAERVADARFERLRSSVGYLISLSEVWTNECMRTNLFVLDELGMRAKASEHHYDCVKGVLDKREGRPLICISNLSLSGLEEVYDDRVASRLSGGTVVEMTGDRRMRSHG